MPSGKLNRKTRYLQVALNSTLDEAREIIAALPVSDRIIIEAGTPLIKRYGTEAIRTLRSFWEARLLGGMLGLTSAMGIHEKGDVDLGAVLNTLRTAMKQQRREAFEHASSAGVGFEAEPEELVPKKFFPYVVADLKTFDRGATEVDLAADAGASGAIASAAAPVETLNAFIARCHERKLDAMIDTMNIEFPLGILRKLKTPPDVVVLHRGVDEETFNREKQLPHHEIHRIKGNYSILLAMAGGDTLREAQRAIFNDIDIVIVWKSFFQHSRDTGKLAEEFLKEIK